MSKINLIAAIAAAFLANPNENKMIVCDDGMPFKVNDKSFADLHVRKEKIDFKEYDRSDYTKEIEALAIEEAKRKGEPEPAAPAGTTEKPVNKMNVAELKEALTALNVAFEETATKADLAALLTEAKNNQESK